MKKFEIGKSYSYIGLYGGEITKTVVSRTSDSVTFDDSPVAQKVFVQGDVESVIAYEYHSEYAKPCDVDIGYLYAG